MLNLPLSARKKLAKLRDAGPFVWCRCIEVSATEAFYLTEHDEVIDHLGIEWWPYPMKMDEQRQSGEGDLTTALLTLSNVGRLPMQYLEEFGWDQGAVTELLVYAPSPAAIIVPYNVRSYINAVSADFESVSLNLGQRNAFGRPFPPQSYIRDKGYPGILRAGT